MCLRGNEIQTCVDIGEPCDADTGDEGCMGHDFIGVWTIEILGFASDV